LLPEFNALGINFKETEPYPVHSRSHDTCHFTEITATGSFIYLFRPTCDSDIDIPHLQRPFIVANFIGSSVKN